MKETDEEAPVLWWTRLENRMRVQLKKYCNQRKMLVPVRFTGSLDDLRQVVGVSSFGKAAIGSVTADLRSFDRNEIIEWCSIFHEYWLKLLRSFDELRRRVIYHQKPSASNAEVEDARTFLSPREESFLRLSVEIMLEIFEKDRLPPSNTENDENVIAWKLAGELDFCNRYMARKILERPELVLNEPI